MATEGRVPARCGGGGAPTTYRRYRIVAEDDLRQGLARMQADLSRRTEGRVVPLETAHGRAR